MMHNQKKNPDGSTMKQRLGIEEKKSPDFRSYLFTEAELSSDRESGAPAEPLAHLPYDVEYRVKERAFEKFLTRSGSTAEISPLVRSPLPRGYRFTTKRKIVFSKAGIRLASDAGRNPVFDSLLEPDTHRKVYHAVEGHLAGRDGAPLARKINFLIVRGEGNELSVIWNLDTLSGDIVRMVTRISEKVMDDTHVVVSSFIFFDPTRSKYFFENDAAERGPFRMKRLFGKRTLSMRMRGILYTFPPTSFAQVNTGIADAMIDHLISFFAGGADRLVDLYCGFGLFSCALGPGYKEIVGVDMSRESVNAAIDNAEHRKGMPPARYLSRTIDHASIRSFLSKKSAREHIILDPPRQGASPGVIEVLCERNAEKAVQIFCGMDVLIRDITRWRRNGYRVVRIVPFDMFPGTASLECIVELVPG
jgi:tRNA/tmRNA/rRNA uracil-C5-methylase (TrmA/RlmC/RlmD family)